MSDSDAAIYLSMVAPAYNEEDNIPQLVQECLAAGRDLGKPFEIVIADDRSTDRTPAVLDELMAETPELRVVRMKKNSGQTAALMASMQAARGTYIATMDADLQNDPADIPRLVKMLEDDQADLVQGWRASRKDSGLRLITSKYGNKFRNWVSRESIHDSGCGLKVFRRECIGRIKLYNGLHRYFATLVRMEGWRIMEIEVNHRPRTAGVAKYGFWNRFFKVIRDGFAVRWMQDRMIFPDADEVTKD